MAEAGWSSGVYGRFAETMSRLALRLSDDIDGYSVGDSECIRNLTSRPIGELLRLTGRAQEEGSAGLGRAHPDPGAARPHVLPAFADLPRPERVQLHTGSWRDALHAGPDTRADALLAAERIHDNKVAVTRGQLRRFGLPENLAQPVLPGTPEFDRMMEKADSDLFVYVVRHDGIPVIVPERIETVRFNHAGLILNAADTVPAAGEIRIQGSAGNYIVPDLNNKSGAFTPPPGTLSASAVPVMERHGLYPQQVTAHDPGTFTDVIYTR